CTLFAFVGLLGLSGADPGRVRRQAGDWGYVPVQPSAQSQYQPGPVQLENSLYGPNSPAIPAPHGRPSYPPPAGLGRSPPP
ncbi:unnamed protein product, partial [Allacma fusca]